MENGRSAFHGRSAFQEKTVIGPIQLYTHYISVIVRSKMQYKKSFFLYSLGMFLTSFCVFLSIYFMFQRFSQVKGFTYQEVLLCHAIVLMGFTLAEIYARGFDCFSGMVRSGEFDRILLRPRSALLQVLGSRFELGRVSRLLQAAVIFTYGICSSNIHWTLRKVFTVVCMLMGCCALFSGLFLIYAALSFFTLEGLEFMNIFTYGLNEHGKYPMGIYGNVILWITTFIVPFAPVQYYPLLYLLDRRQELYLSFLPLTSFLFLVPCYMLWRFGMKHYQSSGS